MKILVTGAAGSVGQIITNHLCKAGHQMIPVDFIEPEKIIFADLRDEKVVFQLFDQYNPDLVIHLAAIKNIQFCEQNKELSHITNFGVTKLITEICQEYKARMIYFSTDYVFGKYDQFWQERDQPCPTTQYGKDKVASELFIQNKLRNHSIIRTAQLYGIKNDFITLICNTLNCGNKLKAFTNLVNCPTWINDLLVMLDRIINQSQHGTFHCVGPEALSRYDFAIKIATKLGLDTAYIEPVALDFSVDIRPSIVRLNGEKTYQTLGFYPKTLTENLSKTTMK
ncbi:SDR family oxidoreductase [Geminocystis sp. NIES-3709]|uniref:SDR family oxidoreductase n=1 Tax=Geminocystis sp. NIES-3709 TaxID=1617448 RepID=UPI000825F36A|nr:SDR family oxidoreductase [Geminocystis sp. NIES-3709]